MRQYTRFEVRDNVAYVTIDRPEARNALGPYVSHELSQHWDRIEADDAIWIAVITGAGDLAFSAGADLKFRGQGIDDAERARLAEMRRTTRPLHTRWYYSKPVIARVNGFAMGAGLETALACDIIVAADHAEIGLPEPRRGLIAGAGGVHRLPRQIPLKTAMGYMLTGRHMPIARAYELGLVNEVVPLAELDAAVERWVADIKRCSPLAIRATKEAAMKGLDAPTLEAAFRGNYEWENRRRESEDAREGPRAFAEKRAPRWQGR
jgi:crotonobetainyl-CoA hydratase/dehydration protein DpgD